jgi:hypothetical protein
MVTLHQWPTSNMLTGCQIVSLFLLFFVMTVTAAGLIRLHKFIAGTIVTNPPLIQSLLD